ncbi:DnaA N-terminal domain-containing protein [Paracoccus aurantiacus]|uniref:DnaA N-terminal domain-containing protein n=1 Tax=Paracoccus aurantiacus TaxID=2599412 RepID=UPI003640D02A
MQVIRPVGREAAAKKYDILSALMAHALAGDQHRQRLVLRLMALITTRYNWQRNELTMGQREIARLWCVDERTVKRDMARLRALGWVQLTRQGARGRVAAHALDLERIMLDTRPEWANIGEDFVARAGGAPPPAGDEKVVPFRRAPVVTAGEIWGRARQFLAAEDPAAYEAWFAGLADAGVEQGCLRLIAPTRFHADYISIHLLGRLRVAVSRTDPSITKVLVQPG